jgi:hypothetical protein
MNVHATVLFVGLLMTSLICSGCATAQRAEDEPDDAMIPPANGMYAPKGWHIARLRGQDRGTAGFFIADGNDWSGGDGVTLRTAAFFRSWDEARTLLAKTSARTRVRILCDDARHPRLEESVILTTFPFEMVPDDLKTLAVR